MSDTTCNGWTNYETWQAALWLSEYAYYDMLLERWEDDGEMPTIDSDDVVAFIEEIVFEKTPEGLLGDILIGWMSSVNWNEIADSFNRDLECEQ